VISTDAKGHLIGGAVFGFVISICVAGICSIPNDPPSTPSDRVAEFERLCAPVLGLAPTIAAECDPCGDRLCCWKPPKIGTDVHDGGALFSCSATRCDAGWPGESVR
jgi:hypothetical protein